MPAYRYYLQPSATKYHPTVLVAPLPQSITNEGVGTSTVPYPLCPHDILRKICEDIFEITYRVTPNRETSLELREPAFLHSTNTPVLIQVSPKQTYNLAEFEAAPMAEMRTLLPLIFTTAIASATRQLWLQCADLGPNLL